jgi:hypothetical protein
MALNEVANKPFARRDFLKITGMVARPRHSPPALLPVPRATPAPAVRDPPQVQRLQAC